MTSNSCTRCGAPLGPEDEAQKRCKKCRAVQNKSVTDRRKRKSDRRLKTVEKAGVDLLMQAVQFGGTNIPHSSELLERLMMYFGGVNGFASMCVKQYYDAPPGSSSRNRLLETIVRLTSKNTDQGGAKKPLTLWTEDELEAELDGRFKLAVEQFQGRILDGQATQETPGIAAPTDSAFHAANIAVSEGGIKELARRAGEQAARELEALPPDSPAG